MDERTGDERKASSSDLRSAEIAGADGLSCVFLAQFLAEIMAEISLARDRRGQVRLP